MEISAQLFNMLVRLILVSTISGLFPLYLKNYLFKIVKRGFLVIRVSVLSNQVHP